LAEPLRELRARLQETQASLAQRLNVAIQTVALWETKRNPRGVALLGLTKLAEDNGHADLAQIFRAAIAKENRRVREDLEQEAFRWGAILTGMAVIRGLAAELQDDPAIGDMHRLRAQTILATVDSMKDFALNSQAWSWRNQK
jgi:transcriptional regulator with XRE-family HTH domain